MPSASEAQRSGAGTLLCQLSPDAFEEPARRCDLLSRTRVVDHEGAGVVGFLAELLEAREQPRGGGLVEARPDEVDVPEVLDALVAAGLQPFGVEAGADAWKTAK